MLKPNIKFLKFKLIRYFHQLIEKILLALKDIQNKIYNFSNFTYYFFSTKSY